MTEGDEMESSLGGVSDAQFGGGSKKEVSLLEAMGHRYTLDGTMKQVSFVRDKHFSDVDVYFEHLRAKVTSTFLDMIDDKHGIICRVTVYLRYSHPTKVLGDMDTIVLHSGKRNVTSPVVLDKQLDSIIDRIRERHITSS